MAVRHLDQTNPQAALQLGAAEIDKQPKDRSLVRTSSSHTSLAHLEPAAALAAPGCGGRAHHGRASE